MVHRASSFETGTENAAMGVEIVGFHTQGWTFLVALSLSLLFLLSRFMLRQLNISAFTLRLLVYHKIISQLVT